jgi:hypothetical protein
MCRVLSVGLLKAELLSEFQKQEIGKCCLWTELCGGNQMLKLRAIL